MHCKDCARFDEENGKCKDDKVNPRDYSSALQIATMFGVRAICVFNHHRESLVEVRQSGKKLALRTRRG